MSNRQYIETDGTTKVTAGINTARYNRILVLRSLEDWNIEDERGNKLPINEVNLSKLPNHIFRTILNRVLEINRESDAVRSPQAEAEFRDEGADGDQVPDDGTSAA